MVPPLPPLSITQRIKRILKLKSNSKLKGGNINHEVRVETSSPQSSSAATNTPMAPATAATELEDPLETILESNMEDKKTPSSVIELVNKKIDLQRKQASLITSYASKIASELDEDQKRSVATLPFIHAYIRALEKMRESIELIETEETKKLERQRARELEAMQERITQAREETRRFYFQRSSTILSLACLSARLSPGPSKFHNLNDSERNTIQAIIQTLTGHKISRKDEVLSGLLSGEGHFHGIPYNRILLIAESYQKFLTEDSTFNEPVAVDGNGRATSTGSDIPSEPKSSTQPNTATEASPKVEEVFEATAASNPDEDIRDDEMKRQTAVEESKRKMAELERDKPLWEETARKREEEAIRQAKIDESKRKLAELERDRSLWEAAAQKRMHKTMVEESRRKLGKLEQDKPLWEEAARRRKEQELQERRKKEEEKIRREKEKHQAVKQKYREEQELERQAQERENEIQQKRSQMFLFTQYMRNEWTMKALLKRYMDLGACFDTTTYTMTNPLDFESIPWPILSASFSINAIQWEAVEKFFEIVQLHLPSKEYQDLVEKSHKRFHPDRWRSRRLLTSVTDELEREILEQAGNTVAQALTPVWKRVTGRE